MMVSKVDPLTSPFVDHTKYHGDEGYVVEKDANGRILLQEQWVTLTASMWPEPTASSRGWKVSTERLPLLAAVFGGAVLVVCLICVLILYRCCVMPRREKHYCLRKITGQVPPPTYPTAIACSQSAVYAEQKGCNWGYTNRLLPSSGPWFTIAPPLHCTQCPGVYPVPRSCSHPGPSSQDSTRKQRPVSQPIFFNGEIVPKTPLPEISEFSPHGNQYASSSILDEVTGKDQDNCEEPTLKTRSLPAWVRSKPRPLSTEDDLNDLYAKVNFSKKRKNRMRNDEAAIIALSKSRSQFLHKDTDSLVDNEAVIVYDERTAL